MKKGKGITLLIFLLGLVILFTIGTSVVEGTNNADPDFILEKTVHGFRDISKIFYSPEEDNIAIIAYSTISIYSIKNDSIYISRTFQECQIQCGCWIGDYIYLTMTNFFNIDLFPINVLSADNLTLVKGLTPKYDTFPELSPSTEGRLLAASSRRDLYVIDTLTDDVIYTYTDPRYYITSISWSHSDDRLATINTGEILRIHKISSNTTFEITGNEIKTIGMFWRHDDLEIYNFNGLNRSMDIIDVNKRRLIQSKFFRIDISAVDINLMANAICIGSLADLLIIGFDELETQSTFSDAVSTVFHTRWNHEKARIITASYDGSIRIYIDKNAGDYNYPPKITINSPQEGVSYDGSFTAKGTVTDDGTILYTSFKINNGNWKLFNNFTSWTMEILPSDLVIGLNTLQIKSSDGEKETISAVNFYYREDIQNLPPTIAISSPTNGSTVNNFISVEGTASDDIGVHQVLVRVGEMTWNVVNGTVNWYYIFDLREYSNQWIQFEAKAFDGELESEIVQILIFINNSFDPQNQKPVITLVAPSDDIEIYFNTTIRGNSIDEGGTVLTYYSINDGPWILESRDIWWDISINSEDLMIDSNLIKIIAHDGELTSDEININITLLEYQHPKVNIEYPTDNMVVEEEIHVRGVVQYGINGNISVYYRINNGTWTLANGGRDWSFLLNPLNFTEGVIHIEVYASDSFRKSEDAMISVVYKTREVNIHTTSPLLIIIIIVVIGIALISLYYMKYR